MSLTRGQIAGALALLLRCVPPTDFRLVGTASSLLRGINVPVSDIDVLFKQRAGVDQWFEALPSERRVEAVPVWLPDAKQYFARVQLNGVVVELSTVEVDSESDTRECFGPGPWRHFDQLDIGGTTVPAVACELRLISEHARSRRDRLQPILEFLRVNGCDIDLVRRGLTDLGTEPAAIDRVLNDLVPRRRV